MKKQIHYIYSNSLDEMVVKGFTTQKVLIDNQGKEKYILCKKFHYTWNDRDCVYYRDDVDDKMLFEVPNNARKTISLKLGKNARLLVKLDKI